MSSIYRKEDGAEDDIWDDTELIKMYNATVDAAYRKLGGSPAYNEWSIGDSCLARYSEDNLVYPAKIVEIRHGTSSRPEYLVLYEGYGNTDWVSYNDLLPATPDDNSQENGNVRMDSSVHETHAKLPVSRGTKSRKDRTHRKSIDFSDPVTHRPRATIPSIAPPPPSVLSDLRVPDEAAALSSMLMSWYMSGYHTGYYQAIKDMKSKK